MSDLSNRLRDRASELSDVGFFATAHEMRQAADLIDQQAAEIERLKKKLAIKLDDYYGTPCEQIRHRQELDDMRSQRDEWRWMASWIWSKLRIWGNNPEHMYPEAAQWFED